MQFFKYWTRAKGTAHGRQGNFDVTCYGYSNESLDDALAVAEKRAQSAANRLANNEVVQDDYYGGSNPMQEEVVEEFTESGETTAIISRNRYGCLVLNTPDVFFADVDKKSESKSEQQNPIATLLNIFGVIQTEAPKSTEEMLIENINSLCQSDPSLGLRLYRTTNGYRIIVTSEIIPAQEPRSQQMLKSLQSDRLYMKLCRTQACYRARLTPKPWRCGSSRPPYRFPFDSSDQEQAYRNWQRDYDGAIDKFATCALIGHFGSEQIHPTASQIVRLHDHYVLNKDRPIA